MTTYLGKSCSFCLPRVPFVNCRQFLYLVISLLVLRAGYGIWLYQFLIIAYLFTFQNFDRAVYSRPIDSGTAACQGKATMSQNVNPSSTAILYSDANIQTAITSLYNSLKSVQHQQAYMHTKQETIANALQHAMAMLQILTKEKQTPTRNNDSTGIVQSECRLPSAFTQNNRQGAESTETNGDNGRREYESQDSARYRGTISHHNPTAYASIIQNKVYNPVSRIVDLNGNQEDTSDWRSNYRYDEPNQQQSEGAHYRTEYSPGLGDGAQEPDSYGGELNNDVSTTYYDSVQNTGYNAASTTLRLIENREEDVAESKHNYQYGEANLHQNEGAQYAPYRTYYSPRRSGIGRPQGERRQSWEPNDVKLPPFNGIEDWKVWVNRFEAVADRRQWHEETRPPVAKAARQNRRLCFYTVAKAYTHKL